MEAAILTWLSSAESYMTFKVRSITTSTWSATLPRALLRSRRCGRARAGHLAHFELVHPGANFYRR